MWKQSTVALCLLLSACHQAKARKHTSGSSRVGSTAAVPARSAPALASAPAVQEPDFGTEIKPANPAKLELTKVTPENLVQLTTSLGWELLSRGGKPQHPGKSWDSQVNVDKGKLFALVAVRCEPKPAPELGNFSASGAAYYRTKQCTLTVFMTQGQGGPNRRSDAVALGEKLLGSTL